VSSGHIGQILSLIKRISDSEEGMLQLSALVEAGVIAEVPLKSIIEKGLRYNWIELDNGILSIEDDPRETADEHRLDTKRRMLMLMIVAEEPKWIRFLRMGPTNVFIGKLTSNEKQLFREFSLLPNEGTLSDEVAEKWWYEAQNFGWYFENKVRVEHGKIGEELSMLWEEERTGLRPIWTSRKNGRAGFDIESIQAQDDTNKRLIEVKATTSGSVFITRNEAKICDENRESYYFHIWNLNRDLPKSSLLCTLNAEEILIHIPSNRGKGSWASVEIPTRAFSKERFICPFED
jgi:hypothetical protein